MDRFFFISIDFYGKASVEFCRVLSHLKKAFVDFDGF